MRENSVMRACWLALGKFSRLFRVNTGRAWVGHNVKRMAGGAVLIHGARPVTLGFGMPDGSPLVGTSDLVGWTQVTITPAMVGQVVAVFTAIETKETGGGDKRAEQVNFIEQVRAAGGIAGFANTPAVAQAIVTDWLRERGAGGENATDH